MNKTNIETSNEERNEIKQISCLRDWYALVAVPVESVRAPLSPLCLSLPDTNTCRAACGQSDSQAKAVHPRRCCSQYSSSRWDRPRAHQMTSSLLMERRRYCLLLTSSINSSAACNLIYINQNTLRRVPNRIHKSKLTGQRERELSSALICSDVKWKSFIIFHGLWILYIWPDLIHTRPSTIGHNTRCSTNSYAYLHWQWVWQIKKFMLLQADDANKTLKVFFYVHSSQVRCPSSTVLLNKREIIRIWFDCLWSFNDLFRLNQNAWPIGRVAEETRRTCTIPICDPLRLALGVVIATEQYLRPSENTIVKNENSHNLRVTT